MQNYRKISVRIDAASGQLLNEFNERIIRDDSLPRLLLADTVIAEFKFMEKPGDNAEEWSCKKFPQSSVFRIIGDIDNDNSTMPIFQAECSLDLSDFANGVIAFLINSNTARFAEAINNYKSRKGEFVIYGINVNNLDEYFVLAKSNFIAENRPCDSEFLSDDDSLKNFTKAELMLLLEQKVSADKLQELADNLDEKIATFEESLELINSQLDTTLEEVE